MTYYATTLHKKYIADLKRLLEPLLTKKMKTNVMDHHAHQTQDLPS
jgi:hypothetical protein